MLGTEIDNCIAKALVTKEAPVSLQSRTVLGGTRNQACAELLKYLKKEYLVLNSCQYWSMAPDGGKIGNKGAPCCQWPGLDDVGSTSGRRFPFPQTATSVLAKKRLQI
jgi:hypothetical protein